MHLCTANGQFTHLLLETLEHLTWAFKDMVSLECLMWAVYDNILALGPTP